MKNNLRYTVWAALALGVIGNVVAVCGGLAYMTVTRSTGLYLPAIQWNSEEGFYLTLSMMFTVAAVSGAVLGALAYFFYADLTRDLEPELKQVEARPEVVPELTAAA
ncbi:MAG: hypothetical protein HYX26_09315 [Acidobacteriales bacterium]|nr:hypothetical protein [Terriglobales bacterium]